jgi:putative hydrolase of the HAD superfamily
VLAMKISTLFLDIGGVLLSNGWDRHTRALAATRFGLDVDEMNRRHLLTVEAYEKGKLTLEEYLARVVFHEARSFSAESFKAAMLEQSRPYLDMIELFRRLKARHGLEIVVVSNEGRELTEHRIKTFDLGTFVDLFVSSCFVHVRKPDPDIYQMALDISQSLPSKAIYVDDRPAFVAVAQRLGIAGIVHSDYEATRAALAAHGLSLDT